MKSNGAQGRELWAYRYRVGDRGSRRVQRGGFASEVDAGEALERTGLDPVLAEDSDAIDRIEAQTRQRELAAALAELRPRDREILLLRAWAELSDAEIAAALSRPIGTVKSRLHRTREQLRNRLGAVGQSAANVLIATVEENGE